MDFFFSHLSLPVFVMQYVMDYCTPLLSIFVVLLGSTLYAMETGEHPAILRNSVTSPAGTTASAIYELEKGGLRPLVNDAIWACYRRALEMGGDNSSVGPGMVYNMGEKPAVSTKTQEIHYVDHRDIHNVANVPSGEMKKEIDHGSGSDSDVDEKGRK